MQIANLCACNIYARQLFRKPLCIRVMWEVNKVVEKARQEGQVQKMKYKTTFTPENRAKIGRFAAACDNYAAIRKYGVGESTDHLFKQKYLAALSVEVKSGNVAKQLQ